MCDRELYNIVEKVLGEDNKDPARRFNRELCRELNIRYSRRGLLGISLRKGLYGNEGLVVHP
jgi:hypothetical protein